MKTNKKSIALAVAAIAACGSALAQSGPVRPSYAFPATPTEKGPAAVQLGTSPVYVSPFVSVAFGNDSNVNLAETNELDSAYQVYSGGIRADARDANSVFMLSLLGTHGRYSDSGDDNYTDSSLNASYDFAFTSRSFLRASWDYVRGHDPRGSTDRGVGSSPDKYFVSTPGLVYSYGAPTAQGRMEFWANRAVKHYLNNRDFTEGSDRNTVDYGGAFYWRVMPKTQLLVEARGTNLDYQMDQSPLSGREARFYAGVTWEATASTSGTVKVGRLEKRFDSNLPKFSGGSWEAMVSWMPRSYSKVDIYSSRQPIESTGLGSFILSDASGIIWTHGWTSFFTTEANARIQKDKYKGFDRKDDITGYGLKANYQFRRWMTLGAEYQRTERDSDLQGYDYDKNLWLISATLTM
jgi:hypothetical protein